MDSSANDIELIRRLRSGDVEAFDLLYGKYAVKLYTFGLKYLHSADEAEDLVQMVFLKIWENHKHLDKDLSFKSYLFTIAYNDVCKLFRKRKYLQKFISETLYETSDSTTSLEEGIDFRSVLEQVQNIVDKLPEKQRTIFRKSRQEGKSSKEIAEEMDLSPGTIDNYISEILTFIRGRLKNTSIAVIFAVSSYFL